MRAPRTGDGAGAAPPEGNAVESIVQEIRQGLAQISARELELRQRELEVGRQYRDLRQAARVAARDEFEQSQQRLAQQSAELNAQAVDISAQRARLAQLAEQLRARQVEIEQQRNELTLRAQQSRQRVETLRSWQARQQQTFEQRVEILRRQEEELRTRVQRAEENIARERKELARQRAALELRAEHLAEGEEKLRAGQAALAAQLEGGQTLAARAERQQQEAALLRTRLDGERQELQSRAAELERQRAQLESERAALEQATRELRREGQQLEAQRAASSATQRQLTAAREALAAQQAAVDKAQAEIDAERARIEAARGALAEEQAALAAAREAHTKQRAEAQAAHEAALAEEARLQRARLAQESEAQRAALAEQRAGVERELSERRSAAERELAAQRTRAMAELEEQRSAVGRAAAEAEARRVEQERELERQAAALETARSALAERERAVAERETELSRAQAELAEARREHERRQAALSAGESELRRAREELERAQAACATERAELDAAGARLAQAERELAEGRAELEERAQRIAQGEAELAGRSEVRESELNAKRCAVEAERQRLAEWEKELLGRRAEVEQALKRVRALEQEAAERDRALRARHEQLLAAETEARQARQALEAEREELARNRATRGAEHAELLERVARRERELREMEALMAARGNPRPTTRGAERADRRRGARRALGLAAAVAVVAAVVWVLAHPPVYRATTALQVSPVDAERVAGHRRALLDPGLLADDPLAGNWRAACEAGQVTARADVREGRLWLQVAGHDRDAVAALVMAAGTAYVAQAETPAGAEPPPGLREAMSRSTQLQAALAEARREHEVDTTALASLPAPEGREAAQAEADRLEAQLAAAATALDGARAELAGLLAGQAPAGVVAAGAVDEVLAEDTLYREDGEEFRGTALQYRTELTVAMLQVTDPLRAARQVFDEVIAAVQEQRALEPPPEIGPVLEDCLAQMQGLAAALASFAEQWRTWLDTAQQMDVREDVVTLLAHQTTVADAGRRLSDELAAVTNRLGQRIAALGSETDGSTRAVVVAAVLRNELTSWKAAADALVSMSEKVTLAGNIELDTLDRKLRGLRNRLVSRREAIAERLQLEADQAAQASYAARIEEVRTQVRQLERQREELVSGLMAALQRLRALDDAARRRDELAGRVRQRASEMEWLETRIAELDAEAARLRAGAGGGEAIELGETSVERVETGRYRGAGWAAGLAFAGTLVVCGLFSVGGSRAGER